ncbi:MAG: lasso peptide biosynthesis B2 protein [Gammaproteobacteria bacterium]|nr:lasso peptide biosynthesis B2 protein [Gammaproteobacteria bacterium]
MSCIWNSTVLARKLHTLAGFTRTQLVLIVPFFFLSGLMRLSMLLLPFRLIASRLGQERQNTVMTVLATEEQERFARRIGSIIRAICKYTPWESKCLVQAMLARVVFRCYSIPHIIFLGLEKTENPEKPLAAHAWVNVGRCFVTGGNGHRNFTVVASFSDVPAVEGVR